MDQAGDLLPRPLTGHRLIGRRYEELRRCGMVGRSPRYHSEELRLPMRVEAGRDGQTVVFTDPRTGKEVLTGGRMDTAFIQESDARKAVERRARAAEALVAKYRALLRRTGLDTPDYRPRGHLSDWRAGIAGVARGDARFRRYVP